MEETAKVQYCCPLKEYYSKDVNLVDTLDISPRIIKCKKPLKVNETYEQLITVKNIGIHPRSISYHTSHPDDTKLKASNLKPYEYLTPSVTLNLRLFITPASKKTAIINRYVFLDFKHPNIRIEIPILVIQKFGTSQSYTPKCVIFPRAVPGTNTYYECALYNSESVSYTYAIRSLHRHITVQAESSKVNPRDISRVVIKLEVTSPSQTTGNMKIRFGNSNETICYCHEPLVSAVYLSTKYIRFEELKFNREAKKKFTICNESQSPLTFRLDFNSKIEPFKETSSSKDSQSYYVDGRQSPSFTSSDEEPSDQPVVEENYDETIVKSFTLEPQEGSIKPMSSTEITLTFKPLFENFNFSDEMEPPFSSNTFIVLNSPEHSFDENVYVEASIDGPEMYVSPKSLDFKKVFLGEEHCENIRITNVDNFITCEVAFFENNAPEYVKAFMSPPQMILEPCETGTFKFTFFALLVGKIFFKLRFKVQNGAYVYVVVKAVSAPVRVKTFPDVVEFGTIPFAVPQKRAVLLMNPLSVPISMQIYADDNGSESPLVLNVDDIKELPPVTIKNPIEYILAARMEDSISAYHDYDTTERKDNYSDYCSVSMSDALSVCSERFQTEVLDKLPELANEVIRQIKAKRVIEKNEPETKVITEVADKLLNLSYFQEFRKYNNYASMNWDAIPSDPVEIYFDTEIINLSPNASHTLTFLVIPNTVGYYNRSISLRCCPRREMCANDEDNDPFRMIVESELMVTKMWIEYNCQVPEITWNRDISIDDHVVYAMSKNDFDIEFKNESPVGGFLHFIVVPCCEIGIMRFRDSQWKFFIPAEKTATAKCQVEFRKLGDVTLTGIVKVVGCNCAIPFHIRAFVEPTKVSISVKEVRMRQKVLETTVFYIFIHNVTPTITGLVLHLRSGRHQSVNPKGAQLAPNGQGVYIELKTMYPDPEVYKNTLTVDMLYGNKEEIPLTYIVTGMPIFFDPDIQYGYDIGTLLMTTNCENYTLNYSKTVRVWNAGERPYTVGFQKLKAFKNTDGGGSCPVYLVKAQFQIEPKLIYLNPGEEKTISIIASSFERVTLTSEFRLIITDQTNPLRVLSRSFELTARFTPPDLRWSRNQIRIVYKRTHKFKQHPHMEIVELINYTGSFIEDVYVKVCGPFKIKTFFEHPFCKDLELSFLPDEHKEILIFLDEKKVRNEICPYVRGKLFCYANDKPQKCVALRVDIHYPDIIIVHSEVVIFTNDEERDTAIVLENVGDLDAQFKWKKIGECTKYIDKYDHYKNHAYELLYDIIRMLELHDEDDMSEDSLCMRNATLCYQKYRCQLAKYNDPNRISDIVFEIIDKLDYEHRRYKITWDDPDDEVESFSEASTRTVVKETFDRIFGKLKLEDSYDVSEASVVECNKEEHFYFYEKEGTINGRNGAYSTLHLPGVNKGYARMGKFILDIVGGHPHKLTITLANLEKIVDIVPENVYLGVLPWYELFKIRIAIQNVTQFKLNLIANDVPRPKANKFSHHHLLDGYACILGSRIFLLNAYGLHVIKSEGILGFASEFVRDFLLIINEHSTSTFRLRGQGIMPILLAIRTDLLRTPQTQAETIEEYKLLQRIYYFSIFHDITYVEDEPEGPMPEEGEDSDHNTDISFSQLSVLSSSECIDSYNYEECDERIFRNWQLLLSTYVFVNNNDSLPHPFLLEQLINMEKFIDDLKMNHAKRNILQRIYREHTQFQRRRDPKIPINLKYFTVQPLPFEQWGYIINMPNLKLGQFRSYYLDLQFLGPGKLIAAARTSVKIPGLYVYFSVKPGSGQEFIYYRSQDKMPDFYKKRYRNMWEREVDQETNQRLLHAHSFDCENRCKYHKREISNKTLRDRQDVRNYYNSLNKSVYSENKHHFINCLIYSDAKANFSGTVVRVNIIIKTDPKFYADAQIIEDYLYVDLHMGPTLPILLRGLIRK